MDRLDYVLLEKILRRLSPSSLAAAEATCRLWAGLIAQQQLWQLHATPGCVCSNTGSRTLQPATAASACIDWRDICLHRAAARKWREGKLLLSATLQGHTAAVTCIAAFHNIVATGSTDSTVRLWDLDMSRQQYVLQHGQAAVVAVALPSISLCATATANAAFLWKQGKRVRRFDVLPGGHITCLALTDTHLLLGSTAATVQYFDLFSGRQQLITRHSSSVTYLLTRRQELQQLPRPLLQDHTDDWQVVVGCYDGQVSCLAVSTGQVLWQLPNKHPSKVVAVTIQQYKQYKQYDDLVAVQPSIARQLHPREQLCERQQCAEGAELLYVLNARSQLICWPLPSSSSNLQVQLPPCDHCIKELLNSTVDATHNTAAPQTATAAAGVAAADANSASNSRRRIGHHSTPASSSSSSSKHGGSSSARQPLAVCQLPVAATSSLLASVQSRPATGCTSMACPAFGNSCVFVGSSDGYLSVAQLGHSEGVHVAHDGTSMHSSSGSSSSADVGARSNSADVAAAGGVTAPQEAVPQQQQQPAVRDAAKFCSSSSSSACNLQLQLVRWYSLQPLGKAVNLHKGGGFRALNPSPAGGPATGVGGTAAPNSGSATAVRGFRTSCSTVTAFGVDDSRGHSQPHTGMNRSRSGSSADSDPNAADGSSGKRQMLAGSGSCARGAREQLPAAASHVTCAVFLEGGKLAVGLASGHVCILRFMAKSQQ